ncbi:MAG: hypothetical protein ABGZ37_10825 [Akkermansiaceae bacterium]
MSETLGVSSRALLVIRVGLLLAAWGWGIAFAFVFSPWEVAAEQLEWMGAREMTYQPMLDYWMRMAGATFGCIGMAAGLALWRPLKFAVIVRLLPAFHFFLGIVLLVSALRNGLRPAIHSSFLLDISFCFSVAALIQLPLWLEGRNSSAPRES